MAHELDVKADGTAAMLSVRQTPWHRLGTVLENWPSLNEALDTAGLNWDVALRPLHILKAETGAGPVYLRSPIGRAVVRMDREEILGIVSERYVPLANRDAFQVFEPLVDRGIARIETAGALRGGRDVWMLAQLRLEDPVVSEVFAGEIAPYVLVTANHSGQRPVVAMLTPVRVVCANTLGAALRGPGQVSVPHVGSARIRLVDAAETLLEGITERYRGLALDFQALRERILTADEFVASVLDELAPYPPEPPASADREARRHHECARVRAMTRRGRLVDAWTQGTGHSGDHSAWEAYQGAVELLDHDADTFPTRGRDRVQSLMDGALGEAKARVFDSMMALVPAGRNE